MERLTSKQIIIIVALIVVILGVFFGLRALLAGWRSPEAKPVSPKAVATPTPLPLAQPTTTFETMLDEKPSSVLDYVQFVEAYGTSHPKFDLNKDGIVDTKDFVIFKERYGE